MADETFGSMDAERGDVLRNTQFEDRFTCPGCHAEHTATVSEDEPKFIRCSCGAPLRLALEYVPEASCYIADEDEEEENIE